MTEAAGFVLAAKCSPEAKLLDAVADAGLGAVELYTNDKWLSRATEVCRLCRGYPLRYAVHAPTAGYDPDGLFALAAGVGATAVVLHNIYWPEEFAELVEKFSALPNCPLCLENSDGVTDPVKYLRRYGLKRCIDVEHLIQQTLGFFPEPFGGVIAEAAHLHVSGYTFGSENWHSHLHYAPEQSRRILDLIRQSGYQGLVVSEAVVEQQTLGEWRRLVEFFAAWEQSEKTAH